MDVWGPSDPQQETKQHRSVDADLRMKLESYGRDVKVEVIFM